MSALSWWYFVLALAFWLALSFGSGYFGLTQPAGYVVQIAGAGLVGRLTGKYL